MPTDAELLELRTQCTWTWVTLNGMSGSLVTSKKNGNSIFLPAASYRYQTDYGSVIGAHAGYWSSCLDLENPISAGGVSFYEGAQYGFSLHGYRSYGRSIRPVSD